MLTTLIYRSHICEDVPIKTLEDMVATASQRNQQMGITGILLFNGRHFFQLLEGPEEGVSAIFQHICEDRRHFNIVELLHDHAPARRFGKVGMELFDLREHSSDALLQRVLEKGTTRYQLTYNDRALQYFRSFVETRNKDNYYEIPPDDYWSFVVEPGASEDVLTEDSTAAYTFAFQPIIDPLAREVVSLEALLRTRDGAPASVYFSTLADDELYRADLDSKKVAFAMAGQLKLNEKTLSVNLMPMTLVNVPDAVRFLVQEIEASGLVPEQVTVEFTENEVISRLDAFTDGVRQLKAAGISVAIEHFGAGFAGLSLLAQFQPDKIKINQDLIRDVHKSGPRQAIIQAIVQCCASLEISVTAVGVEKPQEWMWLESAGISHFQGNLFAKPGQTSIPAVAWPERKGEFLLF